MYTLILLSQRGSLFLAADIFRTVKKGIPVADNDIWTIKAALDWTVGFLERKGDENPRLSAEWLMAEATGLTRIELYVNFERPLSLDERAVLRDFVARRGKGEPLQLISGKVPFRYLTVLVSPGVLIPRPETEVLVSEAFAELKLPRVSDHVAPGEEGEEIQSPDLPELRAVDLCTGSGCIACSIASEYPAAHVVALDIDSTALELARKNVEHLSLEEQVEVRASDLLGAIAPEERGCFDLVISNPPYVPSAVCETLPKEVSDWDPRLALDGGDDGLDLFRRFVPDALECLKPGGVLAVELFEGHLDQACDFAKQHGFECVRVAQDLTGRPRVLIAHKPQ